MINQASVYGTQGVGNAANKPSGRYAGGEWADLQGNFWYFGGGDPFGFKSDLWKYDPVSGIWTWMKGPNTVNAQAVCGTQGVANAANIPGAVGLGSCTWTDLQGNLWLFGGNGYSNSFLPGYLSTLWKYDPITNMWTWMNGPTAVDQPGVFGTKGVAAAANRPGGRAEATARWVDPQGNLWLFGGLGYASNATLGTLNDLWKYDPITNMWTWMAGDNFANQGDVYGTQGVAAATNKPGGRWVWASWADQVGNLWLFGGSGQGGTLKDDLWKFDTNTNLWTWMKGTNGTGSSAGTYGVKCVTAATNNPPGTYENRMCWTDDCGNLWLGFGEKRNDLWKYSPATNNWTWIYGTAAVNQAGVYGTKGVAAPTNVPGERRGGFHYRRNNTNEFWVFAGATNVGNGARNDLWVYYPDKPTAAFTASPLTGCAPLNVSFTDNSTPGCNEVRSRLWNFGDPGSGALNTSTQSNPSHTFNNTGTYIVKLVITNCTGSKDSTTQTITVAGTMNVAVTGTTDPLCNGGITGTASVSVSSGTSPYTYSWSGGGGTSASATGLSAGVYTVTITDATGCQNTQTININQPAAVAAAVGSTNADCNASNGTAGVTSSGGTGAFTYSWNNTQTTASATGLSTGTYTCTITDNNGCSKTASVTVGSNPGPTANAGSSNADCNASNGTASATPSGGSGTFTYSWNNAQAAATATGLSAGTYTCTISDGNGCSTTATATVGSNPGPTATATATATTIQNGQSTTLNGGGGVTYTWSPPDGLSCTNCQNPVATPTITTMYCLTVSDANGCTATACVTVYVETPCPFGETLEVPNAFSPNGDMHNDLFVLNGWQNCVTGFVMIIYNRWGEKVFETEDAAKGWDGTLHGKVQDPGVFAYYISANRQNKPFIRKGNVSLLR